MKILSLIPWLIIVIALAFIYSNWFSKYNTSVQAWEPVIAECSKNGGFMNDKGTCEYNQ